MENGPKFEIIKCGELTIAASCASNTSEEVPGYYPATLLVYAFKGQLHVRTNNQLYSVPRGQFILIRKYTECSVFKTFTNEEGEGGGYTFVLNDEFIKKVIDSFDLKSEKAAPQERAIIVPSNPLLAGLMDSVGRFVNEKEPMDEDITQLKTKEAIMALIKSDPSLIHVFKEFSKSERADLSTFMNYHYLQNITLEELAEQAGRSLSTFNREFKKTFSVTPHKWILKKRLEKAKTMIVHDKAKPSDVYLQVGFEDLAHFSKAFKKEFSVSPSQIYA